MVFKKGLYGYQIHKFRLGQFFCRKLNSGGKGGRLFFQKLRKGFFKVVQPVRVTIQSIIDLHAIIQINQNGIQGWQAMNCYEMLNEH